MMRRRPSTPDYTMGYGAEMVDWFRRFTAENCAGHLLPCLRPGMRLLDFGCGPGTISVGLAEAVAPGEMHGVDMEESQIERARALAETLGQANAVFHVGDALALPFPDSYFDAAHCHEVLMHVPDTSALLAEVKRVLKPGGVIACREMICESCFFFPDFDVLRQVWEVFEGLLIGDDAHPQMGKELKGRLIQAGFADVSVSNSFTTYSAPEDRTFIHRFAHEWFLSEEVTDAAMKYGASTEELAAELQVGFDRWKGDPAAVVAIAFGEAVAVKR